MVDDNGMIDLRFQGNPFTWTNKCNGRANIQERLDRALANAQWKLLFPNATVLHLPASQSDHCPLFLNTVQGTPQPLRPFKFETMWMLSSETEVVI